MSGGSWDYIYSRIEMDAVDRLCQEKSPLRRAFGEHLAICCEALKAIEWVDSGDWPESQEVEAIQKALCDEATQHIVDAVENRLAKFPCAHLFLERRGLARHGGAAVMSLSHSDLLDFSGFMEQVGKQPH